MPLYIPYILNVLLSRRICSRDWHEKVISIRERIGEAMQDMPENEAIKVNIYSGTNSSFLG